MAVAVYHGQNPFSTISDKWFCSGVIYTQALKDGVRRVIFSNRQCAAAAIAHVLPHGRLVYNIIAAPAVPAYLQANS